MGRRYDPPVTSVSAPDVQRQELEAVGGRRPSAPRHTWWLALLAAVGGLWWTLWPTLRAPFGMEDDHNIVDMTAPGGHLSWSRVPETISKLTSEPVGRFRPLYWTGQSVEAALAGRNATWWYLDRLCLATITLLCLYAVLSRVMHPVLAAMVTLLTFSGPQVETWTRLGPNEAYAMPLTAGGLALVLIPALRGKPCPRHAWAGYLLLALAGFAKENFVTLGPSLCLLMVVLAWPHLKRRDWAVVAAVAAVSVADLAVIELKVREYGTLYPQAHTAATMGGFLGHFTVYETVSAALPIAVLIVVLLFRASRPRRVKPALVVAAALTMLVLPQIYLNAGATDVEGRYLYPMVLAVVLLWAYAGWLAEHSAHPRQIGALLAVVLVVPLVVGSAYGRSVATQNTATTTKFQETIRQVEAAAAASHTRSVVLEPGDPYWDYEPVEAYAAYLNAAGYRVTTLPVTTPLPASERSSGYFRGLEGDIDSWSASGTSDLEPLGMLGTSCVSVVWENLAHRCSVSVRGYDARP